MSSYLICGAGGFIGGYLAKNLLEEEHKVSCCDLKPFEYWFQMFDQNKNFSLDLKEYENCLKVTKDVDFVWDVMIFFLIKKISFNLNSKTIKKLLPTL